MRPVVALLLGLLLAGCTGQSSTDLLTAAAPSEGEAQQGLLDEIADRIVQADTVQERALRLCLFSVVATEVGIFRLTNFGAEPGEADRFYGAMLRLRGTVQGLRDMASGGGVVLWANTEIFYAVTEITQAIEGPARGRVRGLFGALLLRDLRSILRQARTSAGQIALASAMMRDVKAAVESSSPTDELWLACLRRMEGNQVRLAGLVGIKMGTRPATSEELSRLRSYDTFDNIPHD